ncbi:MAG: M24 family metallopeptidase [Gammaproteobacteria bacterium]|nr:M24 family metallopeptidase [Gammaproteobacteria bacterium]
MQQLESHSVVILPAAAPSIRNRDVEYPYHPGSDFFYLTGFAEPTAVLVLKREGKRRRWMLFCQERNPQMEQWVGAHIGSERARSEWGADEAWPIEKWSEKLPGLLTGVDHLYFNLGASSPQESSILCQLHQFRMRNRAGVRFPQSVHALDPLLHEMRLYKSADELRMMRKAVAITASAHQRAMKVCRPGMTEGQLEGEILHEFSQQGCRTVAYDSIVAGGNNGCTLHYIRNSDPLQEGELVLIDAGAEWAGYAADVTRTFPINGHFSLPQRQLYELVLKAQQAAIRQVRPGRRWDAPHRAAVRVITQGLITLKILKGDLKQLIKEEKYKPFYMHQTGHWLGMDVHDVGCYQVGGKWRLLEPGMVLTVEPGLYFLRGMKGVAKKWQGTAIRIEDDVVVTEKGCEVLTQQIPKTVDEIEQLQARG